MARRKLSRRGEDLSDMTAISASTLASQLAESWINGNYSYVLDIIDKLPRDFAIGTVTYLTHYLADDEYASNRLRRQLTDNLPRMKF